MSKSTHLAFQVILVVAQFLVPAFAPFTKEQDAAIAGCVAAMQGLLAKIAFDQDPNKTEKPVDPPQPKNSIQGTN